MAQNVGPVLEMVTEKYLLRCEAEWTARQEAIGCLRTIEKALAGGDVRQIARLTTRNFFGPIQTIIPWASNHYTETLIEMVRAKFAGDYWGFLMLGGISGGGMGFIFDPGQKDRGPGLPPAGNGSHETAVAQLDALRHGSRGLRLRHQRPRHAGRVMRGRRRDDARRLLCDLHARVVATGDAGRPARRYAMRSRGLPPVCRTHPRLAGSTEMLLGALFPRPSEDSDGPET